LSRSKGLQTRLAKLTRISLAGTIAERRFNAKRWRRHHSSVDLEAAIELLSHVCESHRERNARLKLHEIEVEQALNGNWHLVEAVAKALLERKSMIGWEVESVIGAAYSEGADRLKL
jgi:hypothetical protein